MEQPVNPPQSLRFGVFEVDLQAGELHKSGVRLKLQEQPLQVLIALLRKPGEIVTRDELRKKLWDADTFVDFEHSLGTPINKIGEVLGDAAENPRFIETLPRRGYRFVGQVTVSPPAASTAAPPGYSDSPRGRHPRTATSQTLRRRGVLGVAAVLAAAVLAWGIGRRVRAGGSLSPIR